MVHKKTRRLKDTKASNNVQLSLLKLKDRLSHPKSRDAIASKNSFKICMICSTPPPPQYIGWRRFRLYSLVQIDVFFFYNALLWITNELIDATKIPLCTVVLLGNILHFWNIFLQGKVRDAWCKNKLFLFFCYYCSEKLTFYQGCVQRPFHIILKKGRNDNYEINWLFFKLPLISIDYSENWKINIL